MHVRNFHGGTGRLVARQLDDVHLAIRADLGYCDSVLRQFPETFSVPARYIKHMMVVAGARDSFTNPVGSVQGGFLAAMLDDTLGPALAATLADGEFAPTLELKVSFLRPAVPGRIIGTGRVVHRGGSIAFLAGELRDDVGQVLATATATVRIVRPLNWS